MKARVCACVLAMCAAAAGCGRPEAPPDALARAGNRFIDRRELERSYALQPAWRKGDTELGSRLTQLHELVIQKLYAQEAERLGLEKDSLMREHLEFLR